jgi:hypothetical protein
VIAAKRPQEAAKSSCGVLLNMQDLEMSSFGSMPAPYQRAKSAQTAARMTHEEQEQAYRRSTCADRHQSP